MMKILKEKCVGCGTCSMNYPDNFEIVNGKAKIKKNTSNKDVISTCPLGAII